ncbi:MAG: autoinducer binding domain-containing protein [Pseudomonadota bacterium]
MGLSNRARDRCVEAESDWVQSNSGLMNWQVEDFAPANENNVSPNEEMGLADYCQHVKIRNYAVFSTSDSGISLPRSVLVHNWPPGLMSNLRRFSLASNTDLVSRAAGTLSPFYWQFEANDGADNEKTGQHMLEVVEEGEFLSGVAIPLFGPYGETWLAVFGGFGRTLRNFEVSTLRCLSSRAVEYEYLHRIVSRASNVPDLGDFETSVLKLCAMGNTNFEIGVSLSVSEHAVNAAFLNVRQKLGAQTDAHAVALAFKFGLIHID